jgi:enterochelin esterase family protein
MSDPLADGGVVIGRDYAPAPELAVEPGVPAGVVHAFIIGSRDSSIYPGNRRLENEVLIRL